MITILYIFLCITPQIPEVLELTVRAFGKLIDVCKELDRMDMQGGSDAGISLREAAEMIERAASALRRDIDRVRRKLTHCC